MNYRINKSKYVLHFALLILIIQFCYSSTGCKKDTTKQDAVYITGTEATAIANLSVVNNGDGMAITATASKILENTAQVQFSFNLDLVDKYNQKYGANYTAMPPETCSLTSATASINAGTNTSTAVKLVISSVDKVKEGVNYLLPIVLKSSTNNIPTLNGSDVLYLLISRAIITSAPVLAGESYFSVDFSKNNDNLKNMSSFTLEARVNLSAFPVYYGENLMGILGNVKSDKTGHWLFVDGTPDRTGVTGPAFMFALNGWSNYVGKGNDNPQTLDTWYHVAGVFQNQQIYLYVNGKLVSSTPYSGPAPSLADGSMPFNIGAAPGVQNGFYFKGMINEARVWSRALSPAELNNNMHQCFVDPASTGLEAYWRMNDNKDELTDFTGHGHTATRKGAAITWRAGVTCP